MSGPPRRSEERVMERPTRAWLVDTLEGFAARLEHHRVELNRLNVYPVPDGDTGDNLVATIGTVLEWLPADDDHEALVEAIARGALLGGRGSSGVIMGQALRGFVGALPDGCAPEDLAAGLEVAATHAREAVADPVEGTILTVASDAARQARGASAYGTLADVVRDAAAEARRSLARTPDLLPPLARAGVVDAGGLGYVLFLDALSEAVAGLASPPLELVAPTLPDLGSDDGAGAAAGVRGGRYEVVCMLASDDDRIPALRERWLALGDTVAIAGGAGMWRGHVHTDEVVAALEAARSAGEVGEVEVTDLAGQIAHESGLAAGEQPVEVVAVAEGDGLVAAYLEAGAYRVVTGGVTAKPSTGELLSALEACGRPPLLLTGDDDVVPAAERALAASSRPGWLVPTEMLAGLLALEAAPPGDAGDPARWAERLTTAARSIRVAKVQRAIRRSETPVGTVQAGEWLAMGEVGPVAVASEAAGALVAAADVLVLPSSTTGLIAVDREAPAGVDPLALLHAAHPHVTWRLLRANRTACAYGVAVR